MHFSHERNKIPVVVFPFGDPSAGNVLSWTVTGVYNDMPQFAKDALQCYVLQS